MFNGYVAKGPEELGRGRNIPVALELALQVSFPPEPLLSHPHSGSLTTPLPCTAGACHTAASFHICLLVLQSPCPLLSPKDRCAGCPSSHFHRVMKLRPRHLPSCTPTPSCRRQLLPVGKSIFSRKRDDPGCTAPGHETFPHLKKTVSHG